jgi:hypothetical protein
MCAVVTILVQAVRDDWYYQMYYDNLPVWGFIGKVGTAGAAAAVL